MDLSTLTHLLNENQLELVIGMETHVRLNTQTKLFCSCPNKEINLPNEYICPICTGQMGVLPAINKEAIKKAIYFGKAVHSSFSNSIISWDRKHYEYPDNPKNIQISQYYRPIIPDGLVSCFRNDGSRFDIELEQVHIEEDAAKLVHEKSASLVDFNKAGVPLIEIVTKPCIRQIADASTYAQYIQRIVQNLNISNANLEKGEFKSDVSVSLRKKGQENLNPRTEIKNLNSFKFMIEALKEEVSKQLNYYIENNSFRPEQTTVLWDEDLKQTKTMRKKEYEADYRFISEPDLPFVDIRTAVEKISVDTSILPFSIEKILIDGGVLPQDAKFFTADANRSTFFRLVNASIKDPLFVARTLTNSLKPTDYEQIPVSHIVDILALFKAEKITIILLQNAISSLRKDSQFDYNTYFNENTISEETVKKAIDVVLRENLTIASDIRKGNKGKAGILVGKVMAKTGKGASGKLIRQLIIDAILSTEDTLEKSIVNQGTHISELRKEQRPIPDEKRLQIPLIVKENYRTHRVSELSESNIDQEIQLAGWAASIRDHGELVFIDLRDASYEVMQIRLERSFFENIDQLARLKPESVISVSGKIIRRAADDINKGIRTGTIELVARDVVILNGAKTLPFEIKKSIHSNEQIRFEYKFLDQRNEQVRKTIIHRHKVLKLLRDILDEKGFIEVETPILTAGTDEGAREFIVPSRKEPGSFYTLPQAPQQFKQMLMVGAIEKYFQVARCFRDEDSRGDRQPEFTQLDLEMAYVSMQDIIDLNTYLFNEIVRQVYGKKWRLHPFEVLTYREAMDKYGCDRPDLRFGLLMQDITDIVKETHFQVFSKPIEQGGIVKCIKVSAAEQGRGRISKGQIEKLTLIAQQNGLGGLAYIIVNKEGLQSPIIKFLGAHIADKIIERACAQEGDIVFFAASDYIVANKALDAVRQALGAMLKLIPPKDLRPVWVVDFPMFEKTDTGKWTFTHNPFSMPAIADLEKHMKGKEDEIGHIIAQQYDLVLNGYEIGGGSIRAHRPEILEATYKNMGYNKKQMMDSVGTMYRAFRYGAPPHGGIAWGIDRLMMILERKNSIREVMAFPKTGSSEDLLFGSPSSLSVSKVEEMNIKIVSKSLKQLK